MKNKLRPGKGVQCALADVGATEAIKMGQSFAVKLKARKSAVAGVDQAMGEYFCEGFHLKNPIQAIFSCNMNHTSQREREQKGESSGAEPTSGLTTDN